MPPARRREIFGWCCFDFANSAFTTIIITTVYAVFFNSVVAGGDPNGPGWWGSALAVSQVVVIFLSPLLGTVADVTARKKRFLMVSALVCSLATMGLFFAGPGEVWLALGLVVVANVAFSLGENFCASFLPEISTAGTVGRISSYGWSFGYLGGLLSLVLALVIIQSGEGRVPWTLVAGETWLGLGWRQLTKIRRELPQHRQLAVFFGAMTLYLAGLAAVVAFAGVFATQVLGMTQGEYIKLFIVLQLAGVAGAYGFGVLQDRVGAKPALILSLLLWIGVCTWAAVCQTKGEFFVIGVMAGAAMGSLQSSGRAVVAMLTPGGRSGEFFGYWGFFGKLAAVIGQLTYGWLATFGGFRLAIACNAGFFLAGLLIIIGLKLKPQT
jgi:UMF1 family MFS transporter